MNFKELKSILQVGDEIQLRELFNPNNCSELIVISKTEDSINLTNNFQIIEQTFVYNSDCIKYRIGVLQNGDPILEISELICKKYSINIRC